MAEFKVVFEGIKLTAAQQKAIREDLQRVAVEHLADLDFGGDRGAAILPLRGGKIGPNGGTQGIVARLIEPKLTREIFPGG